MTITACLHTAGRELTRTQVNSDPIYLSLPYPTNVYLCVFVCVFGFTNAVCIYRRMLYMNKVTHES